MRINELIVENENLDEISLAGIGKGIAKSANVAGKAVGGLARGTIDTAKQFGQGMKQGWQGTKSVMGTDQTSADQPQTTTQQPTAQTQTTASAQSGRATTGKLPSEIRAEKQAAAAQVAQKQMAANQTPPTAAAPTTTAPQLKSPPVVPGNMDSFKKAYSVLDPNEREQLKKDLEVIDDQDRLATGTNEDLEKIIRLARR